jgi:hypothetical protein
MGGYHGLVCIQLHSVHSSSVVDGSLSRIYQSEEVVLHKVVSSLLDQVEDLSVIHRLWLLVNLRRRFVSYSALSQLPPDNFSMSMYHQSARNKHNDASMFIRRL